MTSCLARVRAHLPGAFAVVLLGAFSPVYGAQAQTTDETSTGVTFVEQRAFAPDGKDKAVRVLTEPFRIPEYLLRFGTYPLQILIDTAEAVNLPRLVMETFANDDLTRWVVPYAAYQSNDGFGGGLLVSHVDLWDRGHNARFNAQGWQNRDFSISSGYGFPDFADTNVNLSGSVSFTKDGNQRFFGIGEDSRQEDKSRFEARTTRARLSLGWRLGHAPLSVKLSAGFESHEFSGARADVASFSVEDVFRRDDLPGFERRLRFFDYGLKVAYDSRQTQFPRHGTLISAEIDGGDPLYDRDFAYLRSKVEFSQILGLPGGRQTFALGAKAESTEGLDAQVPFALKSALGRDAPLRSFTSNRFRTRGWWVGSVEYRYLIRERTEPKANNYFVSFFFADVGEPFDDYDDINGEELKWSSGWGFAITSDPVFLLSFTVGTGNEGIGTATMFRWAI